MEPLAVQHLEFIQRAINRYAWQSIAIKAMLLATIATTLVLEIAGGTGGYAGVSGVVITFVLWLIDGQFHDMQARYIERYDQAVRASETDWSMAVSVPASVNVAALWRPTVALLPVAGIAVMAFVTLL